MTSSNKIYIECICGSSVLKCNISIHIKSKRHIRYVNNIKEYISDNKSSCSDEELFEMNKDRILDVCNGIRTSMTSTRSHRLSIILIIKTNTNANNCPKRHETAIPRSDS